MSVIISNIKALGPYVLVFWALLLVGTLLNPQKYFNSILLMLALFFSLFFIAGLFGDYMNTALLGIILLVFLALLLVPLMLIFNGLQMIRRESLRFAHVLSLLLGIGIGVGEIAVVVSLLSTMNYFSASIRNWTLLIGGTVFYGSLLILNFVLYSLYMQLLPHRMNFDYVIIHGCGLSGGRTVTKLLADRIDKAIELYHRCGKKPVLIPSGGKGDDEELSEAEAISDYLLSHGIPEEHILREDRSATTLENLKNSFRLIDDRGGAKRIVLVSSNYHIYRCLSYAKALNMKCVGIGAHTAWYYWPTALLREFAAVARKPRFFIWAVLGYLLFMTPVWLMLFYH